MASIATDGNAGGSGGADGGGEAVKTFNNPRFRCRFYENEFPELEDVVLVQVNKIAEMGAYVSLLEYDGIEGMILLSELSRRRIRSINKLIRVGKNECVSVLRVDKEKGYIDLSKRRVSPEEMEAATEKYNKAKTVHSIVRRVAEKLDMPLIELNKKVTWPLNKSTKWKTTYDAFVFSIQDEEAVFGNLNLDPELLAGMRESIKRRLSPQPIKIRADINVSCYGYEGIDAIKEALKTAENFSSKNMPFKINLIAPPWYAMHTTSIEKQEGIDRCNRAVAAVKKAIEAKGGMLTVKFEARATSVREEEKLEEIMQKMELENEEVDGDEDQ